MIIFLNVGVSHEIIWLFYVFLTPWNLDVFISEANELFFGCYLRILKITNVNKHLFSQGFGRKL